MPNNHLSGVRSPRCLRISAQGVPGDLRAASPPVDNLPRDALAGPSASAAWAPLETTSRAVALVCLSELRFERRGQLLALRARLGDNALRCPRARCGSDACLPGSALRCRQRAASGVTLLSSRASSWRGGGPRAPTRGALRALVRGEGSAESQPARERQWVRCALASRGVRAEKETHVG